MIVLRSPIADRLKAKGSLEPVGFSLIIKNPVSVSSLSTIETV